VQANEVDDGLQANMSSQVGEDEGFVAAHFFGVPFHDGQIGPDLGCQVDFVDDEQVGFGDAGAAFAGNFVPCGDVDDVDGQIHQFGTEGGGEVVAAALDEDQIQIGEVVLQLFDGDQVDGGVFADGGVGAAAGFDAQDAIAFQCLGPHQKLCIFLGVDIVGHHGQLILLAHGFAEGIHQRRFPRSDRASNSDSKCGVHSLLLMVHGSWFIVHGSWFIVFYPSFSNVCLLLLRSFCLLPSALAAK